MYYLNLKLYKIINNLLIKTSLKKIILFFIILFYIKSFSQTENFKKLESPVDIPIILSGNFGELRSSGFHSGIDIKTKGKQGLNIRSVDSGYISRVQISTSGFGKVVYINHANNLTTVYAHLSKFSDKIEKLINKLQYRNKSYEVRKFFKSNELKVGKREIIGYSGNTGSSTGPHLHFETRKTNQELPFNPLNHNYIIKDTIRPYVRNIFLYGIKKGLLKKKKLDLLKINDSTYTTDVIRTIDTIGFGVVSYDRQNYTNNIFGNYKYSVFKNDSLNFEFIFDSFSFDEKPIQRKFVDNEYYITNRSRIVKLFGKQNGNLSFVSKKNEGIVVNKNDDLKIKIKLSDYENNNTYVLLNILGDDNSFEYDNEVTFPFNKIIDNEKKYNLNFNGYELTLNKNTFERKSKILFEYEDDTLSVYNPYIVADKNFEINYPVNKITRGQYLSRKNHDKSTSFVTNEIKNGYYNFKSKSLGKFFLNNDSIPPRVSRNKRIDYKKELQYYIRDLETGIKKYYGKVNGQWALFEYEPKLNKIIFNNDTLIKKNKINKINIYVEDLNGNSTNIIDSLSF